MHELIRAFVSKRKIIQFYFKGAYLFFNYFVNNPLENYFFSTFTALALL